MASVETQLVGVKKRGEKKEKDVDVVDKTAEHFEGNDKCDSQSNGENEPRENDKSEKHIADSKGDKAQDDVSGNKDVDATVDNHRSEENVKPSVVETDMSKPPIEVKQTLEDEGKRDDTDNLLNTKGDDCMTEDGSNKIESGPNEASVKKNGTALDEEEQLVEEDVPANFFDDLMNEDFMDGLDGLDVVDTWDESDLPKRNDAKSKDRKSPIRFPAKSPCDQAKGVVEVGAELHAKHHKEKELLSSRDRRSSRERRSREWRTSRERRSSRERRPSRERRSSDRKSPASKRARLANSPGRKSLTRLCEPFDRKSSPSRKLRSKGKQKPKDVKEEVDVRRDPSKTKRDIQRDKDKCAKDEEAKLISEKLKVVETGLVPPGTEMEVDLDNFSRKKDKASKSDRPSHKQDKHSAAEPGEITAGRRSRSVERRSRSLDRIIERHKIERLRKERLSAERRLIVRRSLERRSMERRSLERRRRLAQARSRSRSPRRRSSLYRRSRSTERRLRDARREERNKRRLSRDMSISPHSDESEREAWLRRPDRAVRSRSKSPLTRKSRSFLKELGRLSKPTEKKSFLTELQEKLYPLDISTLQNSHPMPPHSIPSLMQNFPVGPVPPPMPVPHPNYPNRMPSQEYDQQFFIGQPEMLPKPFPHSEMMQATFRCHGGPAEMVANTFPGPGQPRDMMHNNFAPDMFPQHGFLQQDMAHLVQPMGQMPLMMPMNPQPLQVTMNNNKAMQPSLLPTNETNASRSQQQQQQSDKGIEGYKKLLEEKKITLSDFLSVTAKLTDNSKPVDIQNKIKVITRCQEAIKELSEDSKVTGNFVVRNGTRSRSSEKHVETKHQSPFKKIPLVRFNFTTHLKQNEDKATLTTCLNRLLSKIGTEPVFDSPKPSPVPQETPTTSRTTSVEKQTNSMVSPAVVKPEVVEKFCQTEKFKCDECEARNAITSSNAYSQTVGVLSFDIGCQVSPEDFQKPLLRSILKNQSLAHLTPAQLLAAQMGEDELSPPRDLFPAVRKISPSLDMTPDLKKMRMGVSSHDSFPPSVATRSLERMPSSFERSPISPVGGGVGVGSGGRYGTANPTDFNTDRYDRLAVDTDRERYSVPIVGGGNTSLRSNFERPTGQPVSSARPLPFSNFSSRLHFEPSSFLQKPTRSVPPPSDDNKRPFYEPSMGSSGSTGYGYQGGHRY